MAISSVQTPISTIISVKLLNGSVNMDDLDAQMINLLSGNARMPVAVIAKRLGVARSTVQARLERLEVSGAIAGYTVRLGSAVQSRRVQATALVQVEPRATPQVLSRLKVMPEIVRAHTTTGRFDLILKISCGTTEDLDRVLDSIGAIPGVRGSESLIHLSTRIDRDIG